MFGRAGIRFLFICQTFLLLDAVACSGTGSPVTETPNQPADGCPERLVITGEQLKDEHLKALCTYITADRGDTEYKRAFVDRYRHQIQDFVFLSRESRIFLYSGEGAIGTDGLSSSEFDLLVSILFTNHLARTDEMFDRENYTFHTLLKVTRVALWVLVNPFSETEEMKLFRSNFIAASKHFNGSVCSGAIQESENAADANWPKLRAVLELYTGIDMKNVLLVDSAYSAREYDSIVIVYDCELLKDAKVMECFFYLVQLCEITELNLRRLILREPLPRTAQSIIARCRIEVLAAPICLVACRNLFLTSSCKDDENRGRRIWPALKHVSLFSRGGDAVVYGELNALCKMRETVFIKGIRRQAFRPEDTSVLEYLGIKWLSEEHLPYLMHATNLTTLKIMFVRTQLPYSFLSNMKRLKNLHICFAGLAALPYEITEHLHRLVALNLKGNALKELPGSICMLRKLRRLVLYGNQLTRLPASITECLELDWLDVSDNQLRELPKGMKKLTKLIFLAVPKNNNPNILTYITGCTSLRYLSANANRIRKIPGNSSNLENLVTLQLRGNELRTVTPKIRALSLLENLDLSDNKLKTLPNSFKSMTKLRTIHIANNCFTLVPNCASIILGSRFSLSISVFNNPLRNEDDLAGFGMSTLFSYYKNNIYSEQLYIQKMFEREKIYFYEFQKTKPLYWNMEAIQQIRTPSPPVSSLSAQEVLSIWDSMARPSLPTETEAIDPSRLILMELLVDSLYSSGSGTPSHPDAPPIPLADKDPMKSYLEAILKSAVEHAKANTSLYVGIVKKLVEYLDSHSCELKAILMDLYFFCCFQNDKAADFTEYVENYLVTRKEDDYTAVMGSPHREKAWGSWLYWRPFLGPELGLISDHTGHCAQFTRAKNQCRYDPVEILRAFFDEFSPERVISILTDEINSHKRARDARDYLQMCQQLQPEEEELFFGFVDTPEGTEAELIINPKGTEEVLVEMNVLVRGTQSYATLV